MSLRRDLKAAVLLILVVTLIFIAPSLLFTWLLWTILLPITFWEKLAIIVLGLFLGFCASLILMIFAEEFL